MQKWWVALLFAGLVVGCAPTGGDDDDDDDNNIDTIAFPGACTLGAGYDGAALPAEFPTSSYGVNLGDTIQDFSSCLANSQGVEYHPYAYLGDVVFMSWGAGWCPPCQAEADDIQALFAEFHDSGFVVIMGMFEDYNSGAPSASFLDQWTSTYGITFPVLADAQGAMTQYYRPADQGYIPLNLIVDRDGVVIYNAIGGINVTQVRNIIQGAVDKPATLTYDTP